MTAIENRINGAIRAARAMEEYNLNHTGKQVKDRIDSLLLDISNRTLELQIEGVSASDANDRLNSYLSEQFPVVVETWQDEGALTSLMVEEDLRAIGLVTEVQERLVVFATEIGYLAANVLAARLFDGDCFLTFLEDCRSKTLSVTDRQAIEALTTSVTITEINEIAARQDATDLTNFELLATPLHYALRELGVRHDVAQPLRELSIHVARGTSHLYAKATELGLMDQPGSRRSELDVLHRSCNPQELAAEWADVVDLVKQSKDTAFGPRIVQQAQRHLRFAQKDLTREKVKADDPAATTPLDQVYQATARRLEEVNRDLSIRREAPGHEL